LLTVEFTVVGVPCLGLNGGAESACGWCKDKWGLSWQITPRALLDAMTDPDRTAAKRSFEAMMKMKKIDIAAGDGEEACSLTVSRPDESRQKPRQRFLEFSSLSSGVAAGRDRA
jgi:hypothetical protein